MLYKETDDALISSQSSPTNTTSQAPSIPDKKLKMKFQANSEFTEIAKKKWCQKKCKLLDKNSLEYAFIICQSSFTVSYNIDKQD